MYIVEEWGFFLHGHQLFTIFVESGLSFSPYSQLEFGSTNPRSGGKVWIPLANTLGLSQNSVQRQ